MAQIRVNHKFRAQLPAEPAPSNQFRSECIADEFSANESSSLSSCSARLRPARYGLVAENVMLNAPVLRSALSSVVPWPVASMNCPVPSMIVYVPTP